ncbi:unnamed protein product, partial [Ceratitis capitata]
EVSLDKQISFMTVEEQKCEKYEEKTFRNHEGHYAISPPFEAPPSGVDSRASRLIAEAVS